MWWRLACSAVFIIYGRCIVRPCRPQPRLSAMICRLRCNAASASESASESENSVVRLDDLQCYWAREEEPRIYSPWPYTTACADVPMVTELFALRRPMPYCLRGSQYTHVGVDLPYRICIFNILLSFVHVAQTELNWPSRPTYTMLK